MEKKKRVVLVASITLIVGLIIIYMFFVKTDTIMVTWMPTKDGVEQINEYKKAGYCIAGYIADDYSFAEIKLTEWQKRKWLKNLYEQVEDLIERANEIEYMRFQVSTNTKELIIYADRKVNFESLATYLGIIAWDIEMIQILSGEEDWGLEFTVKDMKTEKVVCQAMFPENRIRVYESMWDDIEE